MKKQAIILLSVLSIFSFSSCKKSDSESDNTSTEKNYSLVVSAGTPAAKYVLNTDELNTGTITTAGNGAETNINVITQKGEYFYGLNDAGNLVKFTSNNKTNTVIKEIPFNQISWAYYSSFFAWKDNSTLVLLSMNSALQFEYATLNTESMTITASGNINIPKPATGYYYWGNSAIFLGNKLYISYNLTSEATDLPLNKVFLASMDFPNVTNVTVTEDSRFNLPSHYTLNQTSSFVYNNYAYFLNSPTLWITGETGGSFSVYRVANGATKIDESYVYEITDKTKEEAIGLFSLGNGKAIVKVSDKTQIESWKDYGKYICDYYVIDVVNKTKIKLDIPKSITANYANNILVDGNNAYIAASTSEGYYLYNYNINTGTVTKGALLNGVNSVSQIVKLK